MMTSEPNKSSSQEANLFSEISSSKTSSLTSDSFKSMEFDESKVKLFSSTLTSSLAAMEFIQIKTINKHENIITALLKFIISPIFKFFYTNLIINIY